MKRALLELQQLRPLGITPRALRENKDALPLPAHLARGGLEGGARRSAVRAVDEDGAGEGHEPAEKGQGAQRGLGGDGAVRGEDGGEQEDVELGLVVGDEDGGAGGEVGGAVEDGEGDAGGEAHGVVEGAGGGVLRDAVVAGEAEGERGEDAVGGAEDEGEVRG